MNKNKIIILGASPQLYAFLREKWKDVVNEEIIFIDHKDQLPPVKETKLQVIFDDLEVKEFKEVFATSTKRKAMPYYHGKRRW